MAKNATEKSDKKANKEKPLFDLRQTRMLQMFLNPADKKHFNNAYRSAVDAGYSDSYAKSITVQSPWLEKAISEILGNPTDKKNLVNKSKKVLNKALEGDDMNIATRTSFFVLGSEEEFSAKSRQETVQLEPPKPRLPKSEKEA